MPKLYSISGVDAAVTGRIAAPTAFTVALAAPAAAVAQPALAPLKGCYVVASAALGDRQAVAVAGTGFTPGATVDVAVDGSVQHHATVDAAGDLRGGIAAPYVADGDRPFTVTVTDPVTGLTASMSSRVTRLRVSVTPKATAARKRVQFAGSGFTAAAPVYVHYVRGGSERLRVGLAPRPTGDCGAFSVRKRLFPFSPKAGRWTLQVDQQRAYAPRPGTAFLRLRVDVGDG